MKKMLKKCCLAGLSLAMLIAAAGCSGGNGGETDSASKTEQEAPCPITINGSEIRVGETTVQTLLDQGINVGFSEMGEDKSITKYEIDPETMLDANSYYSGGTIWISDSAFAHISLVTDTENQTRLGDAVIGRLEFSLTYEHDPNVLNSITLNGVPVSEITHDKASEMFPDFTGDDRMLLKYGSEYKHSLEFNTETTLLSGFSVEKKYDVDWLHKE